MRAQSKYHEFLNTQEQDTVTNSKNPKEVSTLLETAQGRYFFLYKRIKGKARENLIEFGNFSDYQFVKNAVDADDGSEIHARSEIQSRMECKVRKSHTKQKLATTLQVKKDEKRISTEKIALLKKYAEFQDLAKQCEEQINELTEAREKYKKTMALIQSKLQSY